MKINGKTIKAKELAEMAGVSRRTVVKYYAMPREDYEDEAASRRKKAYELRQEGLKWKDVGKALDTSLHGAVALYKRYLKLDLNQQQ
ncbi:TPA: HTH domain-containing protein [Klebsiella pneumoniae]|nr:HTH domain-containing protein [Klebsiella pneumoniae]